MRTDTVWTNRSGEYIETTKPTGYDILINGEDRYINFNTTHGSLGYGFRDNGGTMQFKNNGGAWTNIGTGGSGGIALTDLSATSPLSYDNTTGVFSIPVADTDSDGYLSSTDWNTFNGKQASLGFTPENVANKSTNVVTDAASDTKYPSVKAIKDYADGLVAGLLDYRGAYDASVNTFPASGGSGSAGAIMKGDMWIMSVAGTLGGSAVQIGDSVISNVDTPGQTASNWNILNSNISYVPEDVANKVTSISGSSTDTQYPSAKLLYDQLALKQAVLTFGIADTNAVKIDHASVADNDYAKFTANGLEGRSYAEVLSDIGAQPAGSYLTGNQTITLSGDMTGSGATSIVTTLANGAVDIAHLSATGTPSSSTYLRGDNTWATISGSGDVSKVGTPVDNQIGVWTGDGTIEGDTGFTWDGTTFAIAGNQTITVANGENVVGLTINQNDVTNNLSALKIVSAVSPVGSAAYPLIVENTNTSNNGAFILSYHNSASPAANDFIGGWDGFGKDSAGNDHYYAGINFVASNVTNTTEAGEIAFLVATGGASATKKLWLSATTLYPETSNGISLGSSTKMFSDLFLADGSVINFNNGDVTLTHSLNLLTLAGGNLALGANSLTLTGSIGETGARATKLWATDIESTNMPTVGGTSLSSIFASITHSSQHAVGGTDTVFPADPGADKFLKFNNTSNAIEWADAGGMTNPMTTGGDIIYGGASGTPTRLANGTVGQVLTSAGSTSAPTWETPSATGLTPRIVLPAQIIAAVGTELNLYHDAIVFGSDNGLYSLKDYQVEIICTKGVAKERSFAYTPDSGDVGTVTLTVYVYDSNHTLLDSKATSLVTVAATAPAAVKNILMIGDSLTEASTITTTVRNNFDALGSNTPTFWGFIGTSPNQRQATGGWRFADYAGNTTTYYKFTVSGVTTIAQGAVYTNNSSSFTIQEISLSGGSGYIEGYRSSGTNAPSASGTLTKSSGTGDATITFSASATSSGNPFWNDGTGALDIANYRTNLGMGATKFDIVTIQLGINESLTTELSDATQNLRIGYAEAIIDAFLADNADTKIVIELPSLDGNTKNGWGSNYGATGRKANYQSNIWRLRELLITNFDAGSYSANVHIGIAGLGCDRYYGYNLSSQAISARVATTESVHTNAVHPTTSGYQQMGDVIYPQLLYLSAVTGSTSSSPSPSTSVSSSISSSPSPSSSISSSVSPSSSVSSSVSPSSSISSSPSSSVSPSSSISPSPSGPTSPVYGYVSGGYTGSNVAITDVDKMTYSTGVFATSTASVLSAARRYVASVSDNSTYGYTTGGINNSTAYVNTADRLEFSTDISAANTASNLSENKALHAGLSDGATYGYFGGGASASGANRTQVDRITFSTGASASNTASALSQARRAVSAMSNGSDAGYFSGGNTASTAPVVTVDKITFSTGATAASTASNLSAARYGVSSVSDGTTYGYMAGGADAGTFSQITVDRVVFSTDATSANTVSDLPGAKQYGSGLSDSATYGYFAGGVASAPVSSTYRIVFSTGVTSANTVSNLAVAKSGMGSMSDFGV